MNHTREDLDINYVLTIANEGQWYSDVCVAIEEGRFVKFHHRTKEWIDRIQRDRRESLNTSDRALVYLALWRQYGGKTSAVRDWAEKDDTAIHKSMRHLLDSQAPQPDQTNPITEEEVPMSINTKIAFQTRHYVYGTDVEQMTEEQLIHAIKQLEAEIADLKSVNTSSTRIQKRIEELKSMLTSVVGVLDAR